LHDLLQGAREVLRDSVLPSLTDSSVQHALGSATLDTQLLGFETGGEQQRGRNADVHEQLHGGCRLVMLGFPQQHWQAATHTGCVWLT
jgi:hypothetical protein